MLSLLLRMSRPRQDALIARYQHHFPAPCSHSTLVRLLSLGGLSGASWGTWERTEASAVPPARSSLRFHPPARPPIGSAENTPKSGGDRLPEKGGMGIKCRSLGGSHSREEEGKKREKERRGWRKEKREECRGGKAGGRRQRGNFPFKSSCGPESLESPALLRSRFSKAPEAGAQTCARPGPISTARPHLDLERGRKRE